MRFFFIALFLVANIYASTNKNFTLYKKQGAKKGHTLLVIGGIHGDEPGGYFAPAFLEKYYKIKKGSLWIAPSVNIHSMIANTRGIYKDMNRKFSTISTNDPDYKNVQKIKKLILEKQVDLVLNLHDGHGFYRQTYENSIFNPRAWGQATIIDQEQIHSLEKFGNLDEIASTITSRLNDKKLFKDYHFFGVKNTETKYKDEQQQLSLTFFAVTNNKPSFAIETSKNITDLTEKVIYQLKSIEEFMNIMDIEFEKNFDLDNYEEIKKLIFDFGTVSINDNIKFELNNIKKVLRFVPMQKNSNDFKFEHSLANKKFVNGSYQIYVGNIQVATLFPQYFNIKNSDEKIKVEVDGKVLDTNFTHIIEVKNSFKILKSDFRVNVIGFSKDKVDSEDDILLKKSDMIDRFSIDSSKQLYRVEFYKNNSFYGMITIKFKE